MWSPLLDRVCFGALLIGVMQDGGPVFKPYDGRLAANAKEAQRLEHVGKVLQRLARAEAIEDFRELRWDLLREVLKAIDVE